MSTETKENQNRRHSARLHSDETFDTPSADSVSSLPGQHSVQLSDKPAKDESVRLQRVQIATDGQRLCKLHRQSPSRLYETAKAQPHTK